MAVRTVLLAMTLCALVLAATATLLWPKPEGTSAAGTSVAGVAAGEHHTCAVMTAGGVKCWGYNYFGQLGNGTFTNSSTPVNVSGLSSGVAAVAAGDNHSCAITTAGGLKCWGKNSLGQLGSGIVADTIVTPVDVFGLTSGVAAVTAGNYHTCAITTAGGLKCWGRNSLGELGNGTTTNSSTPVDVSGLTSGVAAVSAGEHHTCAVTTAGGLKCWGSNLYGALGNGTATDSTTPVNVSGLTSGVASVAAGEHHTCARMTAGGLKCWGNNSLGQVGNGTTSTSGCQCIATPVDVSGLTSGVAAIAAGDFHTCALRTTGGLRCWGHNGFGGLGNGTTADSNAPVDVSGLSSGVGAVSGGGYHSCAITTAGVLKCWGYNVSGALGDGTTTSSSIPIDVTGLKPAVGPDSDGDGCPDSAEQQTAIDSEVTGGRRDYLNPYDFYDIDGSKAIDLFVDIFSVAFGYGDDADTVGPGEPDGYDANLDRSEAPMGMDVWDMGAPDGSIDLFTDIFGVAFQFGHSCA
ncbi:MAG: flexitail domain-containing putative surface protein [Dehalococcoidia bacterium]